MNTANIVMAIMFVIMAIVIMIVYALCAINNGESKYEQYLREQHREDLLRDDYEEKEDLS